jgi:hypothetical protein
MNGDRKLSRMLIATAFLGTECKTALEDAEINDIFTVVRDGKAQHLKKAEITHNCSNPEYWVLGCEECNDQGDIKKPCAFVQLEHIPDRPLFDIDYYRENVRYWKTQIGRFAAIGSTLTTEGVAVGAARKVIDHDFRSVNSKIEDREKATQTRRDKVYMHENVCPTCTVKEACWKYGEGPASCNLTVTKPYKVVAQKIVDSNVSVPFTTKQLYTLLENSGELKKRINRFICYATLQLTGKKVVFVIRSRNPRGDSKPTRRCIF